MDNESFDLQVKYRTNDISQEFFVDGEYLVRIYDGKEYRYKIWNAYESVSRETNNEYIYNEEGNDIQRVEVTPTGKMTFTYTIDVYLGKD